MANQENLVEIVSGLGTPPEGVSLETYAIAEVKPADLRGAIRQVTPTYEELVRIKEDKPEVYEHITETPQPEWSLGEGIQLAQQRLSRTKRVTATVLATVTLATGMGGLTYAAKEEVRKDYPEIAKQQGDKKEEILTSVAVGGLGGLFGGLVTNLAGLGLAHRLARRPAQKIVRRAQQESK